MGGISGHERWGVNLRSNNGIDAWLKNEPVVVYDHDLVYEDGDTLHCTRRERPQLLVENGQITYLLTAIYDGQRSWCQPAALKPPVSLE